ncbi:MAG: redox-sensing transcriptional repressor Rex [Ruminococcaceae bacterium]|nr:redox-sensing transcriptional repressor Rex [Oscillospiraceae bacterium]
MGKTAEKQSISPAVIRRLPRYYRYLCELIARGKTRISSSELAHMMNVTASQIRQDLNCFGGFGQHGYGYNVNYLFAKISEILGVSAGFNAIIIGAGDLGRALVHLSMFEKRGVDISALFDTGNDAEGKDCAGVPVYPISELESFCAENKVDIAVLACPKQYVKEIADRCVKLGLKGLWNYMGVELDYTDDDIIVENVHLGDSLMIMNCRICRNMSDDKPVADADISDDEWGDDKESEF